MVRMHYSQRKPEIRNIYFSANAMTTLIQASNVNHHTGRRVKD